MPDDHEILELRTSKKELDPRKPYHYLHEREVDAEGTVRRVNTVFLTNTECPFKCVMCDLWKHTLDEPAPPDAIPTQIEYALQRLPKASVVKLYNNGNFFDTRAIPEAAYPAIAGLLSHYDHVIVENHPKLCNHRCLKFSRMLDGTLEIAMGLETIHPQVLPKLNKQITTDLFKQAAQFLADNGISFRTFLLLNPPFAFDCGAAVCSIIPTRGGNGIMDKLQQQGEFVPPTLDALEEAFERVLALKKGRVFVDLWDLERFSSCPHCFEDRKERLHTMNLTQQPQPGKTCTHC